MPDIRTAQEWNQWLAACGCCPVPLTPAPRLECQSLEGQATVEGYAQFTQPAGDPEDDVPQIYATLSPFTGERYSGTGKSIISGAFPGGDSQEWGATITYDWSTVPGENQSEIGVVTTNQWDAVAETCTTFSGGPAPGNFQGIFDVTFTEVGTQNVCEATERRTETNHVSEQAGDADLQGCPGPFPERDEAEWSYQMAEVSGDKLEDGKSKADLRADAVEDAGEEWPDPAEGTLCTAAFETDWPTIGEIGEWPDCPDGPPEASASATIRRMRYKVGVPSAYSATTYEAQWDEGFFPAAWIAWDEGGRIGPEPTPKPTRVAARTWSFSGDDFSAFFTVEPPAEEGEIRIVNMLVAGSQTKYGRKPTSYGDTYDFDA